MKNKILAILCVALIAVLGFASCEQETACEHTFSAKWSTNETNHWHAATCEHGEIKGQNAAHTDADENGKCDVCEYAVGHTHAFADEWSSDEENHWKAATCTHTDEKGELGLHADDDLNGSCDVCAKHTHILDGAGFCAGCDKEIKPVVETDIASVISATTARWDKVVSGRVEYNVDITTSITGDVIDSRWHNVDYLFGTNGTYSKRYEDETDSETGNKTGNTLISEKWMTIVSSDTVEGIFATSVNGTYTYAEPSAFGLDDLHGYYFAASTLADGHGPEALLLALYNSSINADLNKVSDLIVNHDDESNTYAFSYEVLVINTDVAEGEDDNANFYVVDVEFSYTDNYVLTYLDVQVDCYTNTLEDEAEHDFTYDQATKTITMKDNASADTYTFKVTQTAGEREEIELKDSSEFAPTDFEVYTDTEFTTLAESVTVDVSNLDTELYIKVSPDDAFVSFFRHEFKSVVTDKDGNATTDIMIILVGDVIQILPTKGGEYVVTFSALGKSQTVNVTVTAPEIPGDNFFNVTVNETYSWSENKYTFTAEKQGTYVFYLAPNLGLWKEASYNANRAPEIDSLSFGYTATVHSIEVTLRAGQTFTFYYTAPTKGEFVIGYEVK
jgi:hypothetical protein